VLAGALAEVVEPPAPVLDADPVVDDADPVVEDTDPVEIDLPSAFAWKFANVLVPEVAGLTAKTIPLVQCPGTRQATQIGVVSLTVTLNVPPLFFAPESKPPADVQGLSNDVCDAVCGPLANMKWIVSPAAAVVLSGLKVRPPLPTVTAISAAWTAMADERIAARDVKSIVRMLKD